MNAAIDVFLSAAPPDAAASRELAEALTASGITSFSGASVGSSAEALTALETARMVVLVLSAAANAEPDVVRELERAAGRGIPIIPYAIEDVAPSPSIAYFTVTIPPVPAWSGDRQQTLQVLVQAARRALAESAPMPARATPQTTRYSRATYAEARALQAAIGALLAIAACTNAYAFYRDAGFVLRSLQGQPIVSGITAADHLGLMGMASSQSIWTVIIGSIVVFRRARLNLLSFFGYVQTTAGEIFWRPLVPIASAFWLPAIARDLRSSSGAGDTSEVDDWPLAHYWGLIFLGSYLLIGFRDTALSMAPERLALIIGMSTVLDVFQIALAPLTYLVLAQVLDRVRAKHRSRRTSERSLPAAGTGAVTVEATSTGHDVLVLFVSGDDMIAGSVARVLEEQQCRCWTLRAMEKSAALAAHDLGSFAAVFVVVSRASHDSNAIAELVRSALSGAAPVIPFVVDPPPSGSALGHYIRSLHWIDGAAGPASVRSERVRTVLSSHRVAAGVAVTTVADGVYARLQAGAGVARYRPSKGLRTTARILAIVQVAAASLLGLFAFALAVVPEAAPPEGPFYLALYLAIASLPAWCVFLVWIGIAHRNAVVLQLSGLGSRAWLLCQVAVPGVSLFLGGRAIGRLWATTRPDESKRGWADAVTRFQLTWIVAGVVMAVSVVASVMLGFQESMATAMFASTVLCMAAIVRGLLRARVVTDVGACLDAVARRTWQV
jgi:hypothetical protein